MAWTVCRFRGGGGLARKRGGAVFLERVDTPMHTMKYPEYQVQYLFNITKNK